MYGGSFRPSGRRLGSSVGTEMGWKETALSSKSTLCSAHCSSSTQYYSAQTYYSTLQHLSCEFGATLKLILFMKSTNQQWYSEPLYCVAKPQDCKVSQSEAEKQQQEQQQVDKKYNANNLKAAAETAHERWGVLRIKKGLLGRIGVLALVEMIYVCSILEIICHFTERSPKKYIAGKFLDRKSPRFW